MLSGMFAPFVSNDKDEHPTFIFSVMMRAMFAPFVSDAKDEPPPLIFSVMLSGMFTPFVGPNVRRELWKRRVQTFASA